MKNYNCRHVFFGGLGDGGYKRELDPISLDEQQSCRITLLEGHDCAAAYDTLRDKFKWHQVKDLFRGKQFEAPQTTNSNHSSHAPVQSPRKPTLSQVISNGLPAVPNGIVNVTGPSSIPRMSPASESVSGPEFVVQRNKLGQRVDRNIAVDPDFVKRLEHMKLCNRHHLLRDCNRGIGCQLDHRGTLTSLQLKSMQYVSRMSPCRSGLQCNDRLCILGHACPFRGCTGSGCRFAESLHGVDKTPVQY